MSSKCSIEAVIPQLTQEQEQELNTLCLNEQLLDFMEAGMSNTGESVSDETILERQKKAINAFSKNPRNFWSFS